MRIEMKSFQIPRWLAPVMVLLGLALIPLALMVAVAFGVLAIGTTMLRVFLPSPSSSVVSPPTHFKTLDSKKSEESVIDVEYEVKDPK